MNIIFVSDNGCRHKKISFSWRVLALLALVATIVMITFSISYNYYQKDVISISDKQLLKSFDQLLLKTARLEGQVKRLNSLGKIIAKNNNIDIQNFLLSQAPAMGGLDASKIKNYRSAIITRDSIAKSIDDLEIELELQQQRFEIMKAAKISSQAVLLNKRKTNKAYSFTNPVSHGYISSAYGNRRDPINGHQRHHNGIDIAAKQGSKISTIASGFVTFSGRKGGYGNVVDIHHSDSLKSRYAHLDTIKVKKGDVVRKGDIIATMGRTGRATGSHLHLEVWKKGRPVNPASYIDTALIK